MRSHTLRVVDLVRWEFVFASELVPGMQGRNEYGTRLGSAGSRLRVGHGRCVDLEQLEAPLMECEVSPLRGRRERRSRSWGDRSRVQSTTQPPVRVDWLATSRLVPGRSGFHALLELPSCQGSAVTSHGVGFVRYGILPIPRDVQLSRSPPGSGAPIMRTPQKTTSVRRTVYNSLVVGVMVATVNNLAPDLALLWKIVVAIVGLLWSNS